MNFLKRGLAEEYKKLQEANKWQPDTRLKDYKPDSTPSKRTPQDIYRAEAQARARERNQLTAPFDRVGDVVTQKKPSLLTRANEHLAKTTAEVSAYRSLSKDQQKTQSVSFNFNNSTFTVSPYAAKAIERGTIGSYTPTTEWEKADVDKLKKFVNYSGYGENYAKAALSPNFEEKSVWKENVQPFDDLYGSLLRRHGKAPIKNKVEFAIAHKKEIEKRVAQSTEGNSTDTEYLRYASLTDAERKMYNYILNTKGGKVADAFLRSAVQELYYRQSDKTVKQLQGVLGKSGASMLMSPALGFERGVEGVRDTIGAVGHGIGRLAGEKGEPEIPLETPSSLTAKKLRQDVGGVSGVVSDIGTSIGQMGVGIGANMIAPGIGTLVFGMGAGGNAYADALRDGKSYEEALTYGALIGASEAGLQKVMGGVGALTGKTVVGRVVGDKIDDALKAVAKTPFGQAALKRILDMFGEFAEEYLQEILEPVYRNVAFREDNKVKLFTKDALYSGVLGALTSAAMGGLSGEAGRDYRQAQYEAAGGNDTWGNIAEWAQNSQFGKASTPSARQRLMQRRDAMQNPQLTPEQQAARERAAQRRGEVSASGAAQRQDKGARLIPYSESEIKNFSGGKVLIDGVNTNTVDFVNNSLMEKYNTQKKKPATASDTNMSQTATPEASSGTASNITILQPGTEVKAETQMPDAVGSKPARTSPEQISTRKTVVDNIAKKRGINVEWYNEQTRPDLANKNGAYENGKILINENAEAPLRVWLGHELFHGLDPSDRQAIANVLREGTNENTAAFRQYKAQKMRDYSAEYDKSGRKFTEVDFWEEYAAEHAGNFFDDEGFINKLVRENRTLAQKIYNIIMDILEKIGGAFTGGKRYADSTGAIEVSGISDAQLRRAAEMYSQALDTGGQQGTSTGMPPAYMIRHDKYGNKYRHIQTDMDLFKDIANTKQLQKAAYDFILHGDKGERVNEIIDGKPLEFTRIGAKEYLYGTQSRVLTQSDADGGELYNKKMRIAPSILDLIENANVNYPSNTKHNNSKLFTEGFTNYRGRVRIDNIIFNYIVRVGKATSDNIFYDINLEVEQKVPDAKNSASLKQDSTSVNTNIPQNDNGVNTHSMQKSENDTLAQKSDFKPALPKKEGGDGAKFSLKSNDEFDGKFTTDENGNVRIRDLGAISNSDWAKISRGFKQIGYDVRGAEDARQLYSKYVDQRKFSEEQAKKLRQIFGTDMETASINEEAKQRAAKAVRTFGLTADFREAGYILQNGNMLDFSGKREGGPRGHRSQDHRDINVVFDERTDGGYSEYMVRFMNEGNVRLMEGVGVDIGPVEPTAKQYSAIRRFVDYQMGQHEYFNLDLSGEYGDHVDSREYEGNISTTKIINDIKAYFKNGELPYSSDLQGFRYSLQNSDSKRSKFYDSAQEANVLTEETKVAVKQQEDAFYYEKISNAETLQQATAEISKNPNDAAVSFLSLEPGSASHTDVAKGFILMKQYQDAGDYMSAVEVAKKLRELGTAGGQFIQAYSILSRLTPEGMLYFVKSELDKAKKVVEESHKSKEKIEREIKKLDLTEQELREITEKMKRAVNMPEGRDKAVLIGEIQALAQKKLPSTTSDKLRALQRISLLLNPKTTISRNALANAIMNPVYAVNDFIGSGVDKTLGMFTGTRTIAPPNYADQFRGMKKGVYESFDDFRRDINTRAGDKFEIGQARAFKGTNPVTKTLAFLDRLTSFALDIGDRPFFEGYFLESLNGQMGANKASTPTNDMIDIATQVALEKTWQDRNAVTKGAQAIRNGFNLLSTGKADRFGLGSISIPFVGTTANIGKAIFEFSPAGFVKSLAADLRGFVAVQRNGKMTPAFQRRVANNVAKGVTGTILYAIGMALTQNGITTGADREKDKDIRAFKRNVLGINPYSIKIGDMTGTYDWAQPGAAPLAVSAELAQGGINEQAFVDLFLRAMEVSGNTLFEQSFLTSLRELFGSDDFMSGLMNVLSSTPSQFTPTALKQVAETADPIARSTRGDSLTETAINRVKARVPGLTQTLEPVVDVLGRDVKRYGGDNSYFNIFLNPANVNIANPTKELKEIWRLFESTGNAEVFPRVAPASFSDNKIRFTLTQKERTAFQRTMGRETDKALKSLMASREYRTADDEGKAGIIKKALASAYDKAKFELIKSRGGTPSESLRKASQKGKE